MVCGAHERGLYTCRAYADVAQLVEHNLAKVGVAGSNPVVRSNEVQVSPGKRRGCIASRPGLYPICTPRVAEQRVAEHLVGAFGRASEPMRVHVETAPRRSLRATSARSSRRIAPSGRARIVVVSSVPGASLVMKLYRHIKMRIDTTHDRARQIYDGHSHPFPV